MRILRFFVSLVCALICANPVDFGGFFVLCRNIHDSQDQQIAHPVMMSLLLAFSEFNLNFDSKSPTHQPNHIDYTANIPSDQRKVVLMQTASITMLKHQHKTDI